jgi:hypothetical protein
MENNIKATTLGSIHEELYFNKKVSISFDTLEYDVTADYKVMVQMEPLAIMNLINEIPDHSHNFDLILCWHPNILNKCKNSVLFPFGSCWIEENEQVIHPKTKNLSIISSHKNYAEGHKLRHEVIRNREVEMGVYGNGYNPIGNKIIGLKDYMFSIVIENSKSKNYFTEKIVDCLITGTVPIYWGCENIGDFFDKNGLITFNNIEELSNILPTLNEKTYNKMLPSIKNNLYKAKNYSDFWKRVEIVIKNKIKNI